MPNWCEQRLAIEGSREEIKRFRELIESLEKREPVHKNGFGKYWLGNLVGALGGNWCEIFCRGSISESAGFLGPGDNMYCWVEDKGDDISVMYTTFVSAWGPCEDLLDLIRQTYPSFSIYHEEEDEFYNFATRYDPKNYIADGCYRLSLFDKGEYLETDDLDEVKALIRKNYNVRFRKDCDFDTLQDKLYGYAERHDIELQLLHYVNIDC